MKLKTLLLSSTITLALLGCTNDSTDDLTETIPVDQKVTFSEVNAIIQANCTSCHGNPTNGGAPMSLVTYDNVKTAILERNLIERISIENGGAGLMPQGGPRLPQTVIDVIVKWQADGFQE